MERRLEARMMCADLVQVSWTEPDGKNRRVTANLEDISAAGACLLSDAGIRSGMRVQVKHPNGEFSGIVRYCVFRDESFFLGLEFAAGSKWSPALFKPEHFFDPRELSRH